MKNVWITSGLLSALLLSGCGGSSEKKAEAPAEAPAAAPIDTANAGTVTGKVAFAGQAPAARTISMDATPACARAHSTPQRSEEVIVNSNGTLKNAFVYVKAGLPQREWPVTAPAAKLDQQGCIYTPHVLGVQANQDIEITNSDPTNHNIHPLPKVNREWNESQPPKGEAKTKQFPREEIMIPVKCNVHPWMRSYIGVVSHPYFAVTGDDGSFTIPNLPPGEYTLATWHEKYGEQEQKITVGPKESKTVEFSYKG
ncbi:MAG: carboxypeptidase regulatory-like domain-containing protein [Bryobacteraceae bacterium]